MAAKIVWWISGRISFSCPRIAETNPEARTIVRKVLNANIVTVSIVAEITYLMINSSNKSLHYVLNSLSYDVGK